MTIQSQLIFVCEKLLGWKNCRFDGESPCGNAPDAFGSWRQLPPLTFDLVHEFWLKLKPEQKRAFFDYLYEGTKSDEETEAEYWSVMIVIQDSPLEQRLAALVETIKGTQ